MMEKPGYSVIFITHRHESSRIPTKDWLGRKKFHPFMYKLVMATGDESEAEADVKEALYRAFIEPRWDVRMVIDGDRDSIAMWKGLGVPSMHAASGLSAEGNL